MNKNVNQYLIVRHVFAVMTETLEDNMSQQIAKSMNIFFKTKGIRGKEKDRKKGIIIRLRAS